MAPRWCRRLYRCGRQAIGSASSRLQALLPLLVEPLKRPGHLSLDPGVRESLLVMSSATIARLLAPVRKQSGGNGWRRPPRATSAVRRRVPVRT